MLKIGDLVFVKGKSLLSRAISFVTTGGKWRNFAPSHVAIIATVVNDEIVLIEAGFTGVRYTNLDTYIDYDVWFKRGIGDLDFGAGLKWADSQIGIRYDYPQIIGILFRSILRLFGKRIYNRSKQVKNLLDSKQRFICSELVGRIFRMAGESLWHGDISHWTPHDIDRSEKLYEVKID